MVRIARIEYKYEVPLTQTQTTKIMRSSDITPEDVPVVILAGGRGTRLAEETHLIPKPMVTVGDLPLLYHLIRYYSNFGFKKFIVCLGYKGYVIKEFFLNLPKYTSNLVVSGNGERHEYDNSQRDWQVHLVETGEGTLTATRLLRARDYLTGPHFALTYGDGLSDIALDKQLRFHLEHGKMGTVAAVHPPARFGKLQLQEDGAVEAFREKEQMQREYINGGFFFFSRSFLDRLSTSDNESLEKEPLERLAQDSQLQAFKHHGFWQCMDTVRDREYLQDLYDGGHAPWVVW